MSEEFRPQSNIRGDTPWGKLKYYGRMVLDLQLYTIYRDLKNQLADYSGKVLDVGCGQSPYRFLLNEKCQYTGIDIADADKFDYQNSQIIPFNGMDIPFEADYFDHMICTEVLEHVEKYQTLVNEMYRVLKPGGTGVVTVPFSARYHYIPHDFFRYTPSALNMIFSNFKSVKITPRGSDLAVIGNKVIVLFFRNLIPSNILQWILLPLWIFLLPILILIILIAHISLLFNLGSENDPLGYTIIFKK